MSTLAQSTFGQEGQFAPIAVDLNDAARLLGVSFKTTRREIGRGNLKALRIGRVWRARVAEIDSYLKRLEAANVLVVV